MDESISTEVSTAAPAVESSLAAGGSAPAAPISEQVSTPAVATPQVEVTESAAPVLVPENDDDLKGQENNPHVPAILNLRGQIRQLNTDYGAKLAPWTPIQERWGGAEQVVQGMELVGNLFGQDPTGQPTVGAFVQDVAKLSPSTAWTLYEKLATTELPTAKGPMTPIQGAFEHLGLKWDRLEDYQKFTQGKIAIPGTVQIPEGLDAKYHDAFKQLTQATRELWKSYEPHEQQELLAREQERIDDRAEKEKVRQFMAETKAKEQQQAQQTLVDAQNKAIDGIRSEMYQKLLTGLTADWKPSGDAQESSRAYAGVMLACAAMIDPDLRGLAQAQLEAAGFDIPFNVLDAAVETVTVETQKAIALAKQGEPFLASQAQVKANGAKSQLETLLSHAALKLAGVKSTQLQANRETLNGAIDAAKQGRPTIGGVATEGLRNGAVVQTTAEKEAFYKQFAAQRA